MAARLHLALLIMTVVGLILGPRAALAALAAPSVPSIEIGPAPCGAPAGDHEHPGDDDPCEDWEEPEETRDGSEERPDDDAIDRDADVLASMVTRLQAHDTVAEVRDEHRDGLLRPPRA